MMVVRPDRNEFPGGDIEHAERAASALRELGVDVDVAATDAPDPRGYDVAHVIGVFRPPTAARQMAAIRRAGVPLVLSPIWLDLRPYFGTAPQLGWALAAGRAGGVERRLARLPAWNRPARLRGRTARGAAREIVLQRDLIATADVVLPASETEVFLYRERLGIDPGRSIVAPLGVEERYFTLPRPVHRSGVLCAGRVEAKKNQAALLYALRDVDVEVTVIGRADDEAYVRLARRWASPRTRFVSQLAHDDVLALMAGAAVHALPSWFESPGLASLEAAATGARCVVGNRGCEPEYFGPDVDYADPAEPASIRSAVLRALERAPRHAGDALEARLRARTWRRHAEATLLGYERALAR